MGRNGLLTAGWAVLTAGAAAVVWWGMGPLLAAQPVVAPPPSAGRTLGVAGQDAVPSPGSVPASSAPAAPSPSVTPPTESPHEVDGWEVAGGDYRRSFTVAGGVVEIEIRDTVVYLISGTPNAGFTMTSTQPSPQRLVVEFHRIGERYVIDAIWWENRPYAEVNHVS